MVMLTAMAIARERERGTMEQLLVSPVTPFELVAGKIAPYVLVLAGDALSLWLWSWPFDWTPIGRLRELNAHYGASLHLSVGLVLAVVLWLLEAHHG